MKAFFREVYSAPKDSKLNREYQRALFVFIPLYYFLSFATSYLLSRSGIQNDRPDLDDIFKAPVGFVFSILVIPVLEEVAFRGFLLKILHRRLEAREANNIQAFIFAFGHPNNPVATFIFGYALGINVLRTRSLRLATLAHIVLNSSLVLTSLILNLFYTELTDEIIFKVVGLPALVVALVAAAIVSRTTRLQELLSRKNIRSEEAAIPAPRGHFVRNGLAFIVLLFITIAIDSRLGLSEMATRWTGMHFDHRFK
jgi:membrane protease YdiL (CAAX protease family)